VGAHSARFAAAFANRFGADVIGAMVACAAVQAADFVQFAVHVDEVLAACAFVQVIDVLGDNQYIAGEFAFQLRKGKVRGIRLYAGVVQLPTAGIVKLMHQRGVFGETFRGGNLFDTVVVPQAITGAEGLDAGFGRNARASEDDDVGGVQAFSPAGSGVILDFYT
jgi:hypothetical protein